MYRTPVIPACSEYTFHFISEPLWRPSQSVQAGIQFLLVCLISILAFGCSKAPYAGQTKDTLDRIRRTGQIEACMVVDPPWGMKNSKTGAYSGVSIDMMELIAQKMNAKVNWHETTYGDAAADLVSRRCDIVATYFNANITRALAIAFTMPPIQYAGESALARREDPRFKNVHDIYELDRPNLTIAVATGEAGDVFLKDNFKKVHIKRVDVQSSDITRDFVEVSAGRADLAIADENTVATYARTHPEVTDLFARQPFSLNPTGWGVRQDDVKWLHFIETALQFLDTQGTLDQVNRKYNAHFPHLDKQYKLQ